MKDVFLISLSISVFTMCNNTASAIDLEIYREIEKNIWTNYSI